MRVAGVKLRASERIVHVQRRALLLHIPWILLGTALAVLPFFYFFSLLAFGWVGTFMLGAFVGLGAWILARQAAVWRGTLLMLTSQRLVAVRQRGLFDRRVSEAPLRSLSKVAYRRRGFSGLFGIGMVRVLFSGATPAIRLTGYRRPKRLYELIQEWHKLS